MSTQATLTRLTLRDILKTYREGEKLTMLTAYDAVTAQLVDEAGVEMVLVGDSLGNVILGYDTTIPVTMEDMIRHAAAVVRGTRRALVVFDLPFGAATDPETALRNSIRAFQETGCQAVKLEGDSKAAPIVKRLTEQGIPVVAHIGLTPQSVHQLGGYYQHGKTPEAVERLIASAQALQQAGAFCVVLECVVPEVAAEITEILSIPTIGIGSGTSCSGQVLVINDVVGLSTRPTPKFAKRRADVASIIREAAREYIEETKSSATTPEANPPFSHEGSEELSDEVSDDLSVPSQPPGSPSC